MATQTEVTLVLDGAGRKCYFREYGGEAILAEGVGMTDLYGKAFAAGLRVKVMATTRDTRI